MRPANAITPMTKRVLRLPVPSDFRLVNRIVLTINMLRNPTSIIIKIEKS